MFGDSLSDAGNNAAVLDSLFAPAKPRTPTPIADNTFVPDFPYASDRYTNDRVWAEVFAQSIGTSANALLLGGTNFAFGGARIGPAAASFPVPFPPTLATQVGTFLSASGGFAPASALYVVAGGGNDARDALQAIANGADVAGTIGQTAAGYANHVAAMLGQLRAAGAHHIVVWNTPNLSLAPAVQADGPLAIALASAIVATMNGALANVLGAFPGVRLFDVFDVFTDLASAPADFGLTNVTDACAQFVGCDAERFLFWDGAHPSSAGHRLIAEAMVRAIPEPSTLPLLLVGPAIALVVGRRTRRSNHDVHCSLPSA